MGRVRISALTRICGQDAWLAMLVSFQILAATLSTVLLLPLLEIREFRLLQVDPFLYHGFGAVLKAVLVTLPWFGEALALMTLVPHLKHPDKAYRWILVGTGISVLKITMLVAQTVFVFGPNLPTRYIYPIYYMVQMISIAKIFERFEVVLGGIGLSLPVCGCGGGCAEPWPEESPLAGGGCGVGGDAALPDLEQHL